MDVFDQAQELERMDRESALIRASRRPYSEGPEWIDGIPCCRNCGEPISPRRLAAIPGVGLCTQCQEEEEKEYEEC